MTNIEVIEREVEKLSPEELAEFRAWFIEHDWETWDRELERDSRRRPPGTVRHGSSGGS